MAKKKKKLLPTPITISGNGNIIGDNNISYFQKDVLTPGSSIQEVRSLLDDIQKLLNRSGDKSTTRQDIEVDLESLRELVKKPNPEKPTVLSRLEHIKELLNTGLGLSAAVTQLMPVVEKMIQWVTLNL